MYKVYTEDILKWEYNGDLFHACLCDPPYHLTSIVDRFGKNGSALAQFGTDGVYSRHSSGFMGQKWDGGDVAFRPETWNAIGNYLLPGAYLLAFGGTRTWHRLACAIEDAGFEIRDTVMWLYGSGFPKSHNIGKALDKMAGAERKKVGEYTHPDGKPRNWKDHNQSKGEITYGHNHGMERDITSPTTEEAKQWDGYGTALKPAFEPIIVARKPVEGTIANNCVEYGSGALNIDGCRVPTDENIPINKLEEWSGFGQKVKPDYEQEINNKGRWPANVIHDGSEEVLEGFPQTGKSQGGKSGHFEAYSKGYNEEYYNGALPGYGDSGSAARFFYTAKVSPSERNAGMQEGEKCVHPTLKPISLTEYLAKLILPPVEYAPRRLLVPFSGAGSEMIGAHKAGWEEIVGIELSPEYTEIAEARLKYWTSIPKQMEFK